MDLFDFAVKIKDYINQDIGEVTFWAYGIDAEDSSRSCDINTRYMTVRDKEGKLFRVIIQNI
jgi:hypothetical protein